MDVTVENLATMNLPTIIFCLDKSVLFSDFTCYL